MRRSTLGCLSFSQATDIFLNGTDGERLTAFAAARLGLSKAEAATQIRCGLVPLILVALEHGPVVPSPSVGTLIDLAREHGSQEMIDLLPFESGAGMEPAEFLKAYGEARELVLAKWPEQPNPRLWPTPEAFNVCEAPRYKSSGGSCD